MFKNPNTPWLQTRKYIFDVQYNPRLEGKPRMFTLRWQTPYGDTLQVRVGPLVFFFERKKAVIPQPSE